MIINIAEFTPKRVVFRHLTIIIVSKYYRFHDKNFLGNHKCTASHYIIFVELHNVIVFLIVILIVYFFFKIPIQYKYFINS